MFRSKRAIQEGIKGVQYENATNSQKQKTNRNARHLYGIDMLSDCQALGFDHQPRATVPTALSQFVGNRRHQCPGYLFLKSTVYDMLQYHGRCKEK